MSVYVWILDCFFYEWHRHLSVALSRHCPSSRPAVARLDRKAADAASQGAEADVKGFTHLKALKRQTQDERWLLGGRKGGRGLNPAIRPPASSPSSSLLPTLFSAVASPVVSTQIALCKQKQSWSKKSVLNPNVWQRCYRHFWDFFDQKLLLENGFQQSKFPWLPGWFDRQTYIKSVGEEGAALMQPRLHSYLHRQMASWGACRADAAGVIAALLDERVIEVLLLFISKLVNLARGSCRWADKNV